MITVKDIIAIIQADGWYLVNTKDSHRQFKHPTKKRRFIVPGKLSDNLAPGTLSSIYKQAQIPRR